MYVRVAQRSEAALCDLCACADLRYATVGLPLPLAIYRLPDEMPLECVINR